MNYLAHYDKLIERARNRVLEGYIERHHVIPKCMGGSDDADNIVRLTAREHFVAHQLLVKIYPNIGGLISAVRYLTSTRKGNPVKSRMYEWLRKKHAAQMSLNNKGKKMTPEQIAKAAASHVGKSLSAEHRNKISKSLQGHKWSDNKKSNLQKIRQAKEAERKAAGISHHNSGVVRTEEWKKENGLRFKGKKQTPEQIAKRVASRKATLAKKSERNLSWI